MANGIVVTHGIGDSLPNAATVGQSSDSDSSNQLSGSLCGVCGCGTCTVNSFFQNGCPRPSQVSALAFPFLDLSHMDSDHQRLKHLGRLYLEYQMMVWRFTTLKKDIHRLVTARKLTFNHLSRILIKLDSFLPSMPHDDKMAEVKKLRTVAKLFSVLPEDASLLEYHVFEDIAEELNLNEGKDKVHEYKQQLDTFCKRGIFECPSFSPTNKANHSNMILIHRNHSKMCIQDLIMLQDQVCGVLSVVSNTLCLCVVSRAQMDNIQIIFRIPNFVKDVLNPLSAEQQNSLRQLGFLQWSFYTGTDISYDGMQLANQLLSTEALSSLVNHAATTGGGGAGGGGHSSNLAEVPRSEEASSDDDDDDEPSRKKLKPAPGKKTRGRVKIPMEYIKNKLRRYTTFSKRKSNIMKKAYELSTLTGTQVMLMVASETGHVYTFATPKLQPMITSETGKALIQTCLHQPDPAPQSTDEDTQERIRMSSSGYEETDLGGYLPGGGSGSGGAGGGGSNGAGGGDSGKEKNYSSSSSSLLPSSVNHRMPSIYNPPPPSLPPSLANELLPGGMLQSLVTSSSQSLLPPPLISPDVYSPTAAAEDNDQVRESVLGSHSPGS